MYEYEIRDLNYRYADIWTEVFDQLERQVRKWGIQDHPDGTMASAFSLAGAEQAKETCEWMRENGDLAWIHILDEEVLEAFAENPGTEELRNELIQVAAVAVAWIENIDRRKDANSV